METFSDPEKEGSEDDVPVNFVEEEPPDEKAIFLQQEITECFALFDKKKTGEMEERHLEKALKCLGIFLTSYEMEDVQENLVIDGVITFPKFQEYAFEKLSEYDDIEFLKIAFRALDHDNEGFLPTERLRKWLTTLGDPLTEKETKDLLKMGDPANRGFISYYDLVMVLTVK